MMVDTDVLIWAARGNQRAALALADAPGFSISVVTYIEIVQGARNAAEVRMFQKALRAYGAAVVQINETISMRAMFLVEQFALAHALALADALIAATALHHGMELLTGNRRHFRVVPGLVAREFRP